MARTDTLGHFLTDVADAIREKKGTEETITASDFDTEIENLPSGGSTLDWSALGYSGEPKSIEDDYNYALEIKNNWVVSTSYNSKFMNDKNLVFMPFVDTSSATRLGSMFASCASLSQIALLDFSSATGISSMFNGCSKIKEIPAFNTENVTNMEGLFNNCNNLEKIPILNTAKVKMLQNTFFGCPKLTDESLDNILQMCINAVSYTSTKTLLYLGFSSSNYPASRIQALPHYQDFINAGWTIGYE